MVTEYGPLDAGNPVGPEEEVTMPHYDEDVPACVQFIVDHAEALSIAARLIGGPDAEKRFSHLTEQLRNCPVVTRRVAQEIDALERLLSGNREEYSGPTTGCLLDRIDPAGPEREEFRCLLHELQAALLDGPDNGS